MTHAQIVKELEKILAGIDGDSYTHENITELIKNIHN